MDNTTLDRRQRPRQQLQQQPQQSASLPAAGKPASSPDSPRRQWQALIDAQARKQSGKL